MMSLGIGLTVATFGPIALFLATLLMRQSTDVEPTYWFSASTGATALALALLGFLRVIHIQARSIERQHLLRREALHRFANHLDILASLARQDQRDGRGTPICEQRVQAIALVNRYIFDADAPERGFVHLTGYLRKLVDHLQNAFDRDGIEYVCVSDGVILTVEELLPIALMVTEMITNAHRHAFCATGPEHAEHIRIALQGKRNYFAIEVADNGVGAPPEANGFGMGLIRDLADQLGATVAFNATSTGTVWRIEVSQKRRSRWTIGCDPGVVPSVGPINDALRRT